MAVTFASLHIAGTIPVSIDVLKMMCKGGARAWASSFNTVGCTRSGPGDFPGFNVLSFLRMLYSEIITSSSVSVKFCFGRVGISPLSSFVKTPLKVSDSTSAFSLSDFVLVGFPWPSVVFGISSSDIPCRVSEFFRV